MTQYRVIVNKLNKRTQPVIDFTDKSSISGTVGMGDPIEGIEEISTINGKWIRDEKGFFYWGGGVELQGTAVPQNLYLTDYNTLISNIPEYFRNTHGINTKIAVLDTGIYTKHKALSHVEISKLIKESDEIDTDGHGTNCTGLIGAKTCENFSVSGIANKSQIISLKIANDKNSFNGDNFVKGLEWICEKKNIDVVNLSFLVSPKDIESKIKSLIISLPETCVLVAACRDNDYLFKPYISYPASVPEIISIGALSTESFRKNLSQGKQLNPQINYLMSFDSLVTAGIEDQNDEEYVTGSSFCTSILVGLVSLIISYFKANHIPYNRITVKERLNSIAVPLTNESLIEKNKLYIL